MSSPDAAAPRILCAGIIVLDEVFRVEQFPRADGKVQASGFFVVNGGCAANAAVTIARLGGRAALAGPMGGPAGEDANGDRVLKALAREQVDCTFCQRVDGLATALSAIFMNARGDRTIVTYRDEAIAATAPADPAAAVAAADAVLADNRYPDFVQPICEAARAAGLARRARRRHGRRVEDDPLFRIATHVDLFVRMPARNHRRRPISARGLPASPADRRISRGEQRAARHRLPRPTARCAALAGVRDRRGRHARRRRRLARRLRAGAGRGQDRDRSHALRRGRRRHQVQPDRRLGRCAQPRRSRGAVGRDGVRVCASESGSRPTGFALARIFHIASLA